MKSKCLTEEQIASYLDGLASTEERQYIMEHLRDCSECANEMDFILRFNIISDFEDSERFHLTQNETESGFPGKSRANEFLGIHSSNERGIHPPISGLSLVASSENIFENLDRNFGSNDSLNKEMNKFTDKDICAIKAQKIVLEDFGIPVSEQKLIDEAIEHGWYSHGKGTLMVNCGKLLELHGVEVELAYNFTIQAIVDEIKKGNKIIAGVDSGELWAQTPEDIIREIREDEIELIPDHVLLVIDIDHSEMGENKVVIRDTTSNGEQKRYPIYRFMDAWQDSGYFVIIAKKK